MRQFNGDYREYKMAIEWKLKGIKWNLNGDAWQSHGNIMGYTIPQIRTLNIPQF